MIQYIWIHLLPTSTTSQNHPLYQLALYIPDNMANVLMVIQPNERFNPTTKRGTKTGLWRTFFLPRDNPKEGERETACVCVCVCMCQKKRTTLLLKGMGETRTRNNCICIQTHTHTHTHQHKRFGLICTCAFFTFFKKII